METKLKPEVIINRKYWGLSYPTLVAGSLVVLAIAYMIYRIYMATIAVMAVS